MFRLFWSLIVWFCLIHSQQLIAQSMEGQLLQAMGQATVSLPATAVDIVLGIRVLQTEAALVQADLNKKSQELMSFLRTASVQKLRTLSYRIQPKTRFQNGKQIDEGFEGHLRVSFQTEPEKAGRLLDQAVQQGASEIESVRFTAKDQEIDAAEKQATEMAAKQAVDEGRRILRSLDLAFVSIHRIDLQPARGVLPLESRSLSFSTTAAAPSADLESGDISISAQVSVLLKYKPN